MTNKKGRSITSTVSSSGKTGNFLRKFIKLKEKVDKLPPFSVAEEASFKQSMDIYHLYNSSKVEGTVLTSQQIQDAIHGQK